MRGLARGAVRRNQLTPGEYFQRNIAITTSGVEDPLVLRFCIDKIGIDHIMVEVDYPHGDSTWPNTQAVIEQAWGHLPADERRKLCSENAAALFRHPLPDVVLPKG